VLPVCCRGSCTTTRLFLQAGHVAAPRVTCTVSCSLLSCGCECAPQPCAAAKVPTPDLLCSCVSVCTQEGDTIDVKGPFGKFSYEGQGSYTLNRYAGSTKVYYVQCDCASLPDQSTPYSCRHAAPCFLLCCAVLCQFGPMLTCMTDI
jgi:hypothetical protein